MSKYEFSITDEMKQLIENDIVQVKAYEDNGYGIPFVELQTDLEKTNIDFTEFVGKFNTITEANKCTLEVAQMLGIDGIIIQ